MTDKFLPIVANTNKEPSVAHKKLSDMGDGTFAEVVVASNRDDWQAITVSGKTIDHTKDIVQQFADGTTQTIYFDSNGDWAGISARA